MSTQQGTPSTYSPEYRAFQHFYETLILTVKLQPGAFCDSLFARGYIPEAVRDYTRNESNVDEKKAEKLVDSVIDQIKHNSVVFHGFTEILRNRSITHLQRGYKSSVRTCIGQNTESSRLQLSPLQRAMMVIQHIIIVCVL